MGMYTEIFVNVDLLAQTPENVLAVLRSMCGEEGAGPLPEELPDWSYLFYNRGFKLNTSCRMLTKDSHSGCYSLLAKGDTKNCGQIEAFFEWLMPWVDAYEGVFIGYSRYEENYRPTLIFKA
jgi:hypothetical protein